MTDIAKHTDLQTLNIVFLPHYLVPIGQVWPGMAMENKRPHKGALLFLVVG